MAAMRLPLTTTLVFSGPSGRTTVAPRISVVTLLPFKGRGWPSIVRPLVDCCWRRTRMVDILEGVDASPAALHPPAVPAMKEPLDLRRTCSSFRQALPRRGFLQAGVLGTAGLSLPSLLAHEAAASPS